MRQEQFRRACLILFAATTWGIIAGVASAAEYLPFAASLHVHTDVSGPDLELTLPDHWFALTPLDTVKTENAQGLDVLGLSDHDKSITDNDWSYLKWLEGETQNGNGPYVTCLRGFEWTYGDIWHGDHDDVAATYDHANVFGTGEWGKAPTYVDAGHGLRALADWLQTRADDDPVVQFNHVWRGTRFLDFDGWSASLDSWFRLIEVGGHETRRYQSPSQSESYLNSALIKGWHVAPTIGRDNFNALDDKARKYHTVVWAHDPKPATILAALRERRVYASEDENIRIRYTCAVRNATPDYWMGTRGVSLSPGQSLQVDIQISDVDASLDPRQADWVEAADLLSPSYTSSLQLVQAFGRLSSGVGGWKATLPYGVIAKLPRVMHSGEACLLLRVRQNDGDCAYTAPIWVKLTDAPQPPATAKFASPIFVLDRSGSMDGVQKQLGEQAAEMATRLLQQANRIAVLNFSGLDNAAIDAPFTKDANAIVNAIQHPSIDNGGTALYDAIQKAIREIESKGEKARIIVMTDGGENSSRSSLQQAIEKAAGKDVPCVVVAFKTSDLQEPALRELATRTRGVYYWIDGFNLDQFMDDYAAFDRASSHTNPLINAPLP